MQIWPVLPTTKKSKISDWPPQSVKMYTLYGNPYQLRFSVSREVVHARYRQTIPLLARSHKLLQPIFRNTRDCRARCSKIMKRNLFSSTCQTNGWQNDFPHNCVYIFQNTVKKRGTSHRQRGVAASSPMVLQPQDRSARLLELSFMTSNPVVSVLKFYDADLIISTPRESYHRSLDHVVDTAYAPDKPKTT